MSLTTVELLKSWINRLFQYLKRSDSLKKMTDLEMQDYMEKKRLEKLKFAKYFPKKPGCCWAYNPKTKPKASKGTDEE